MLLLQNLESDNQGDFALFIIIVSFDRMGWKYDVKRERAVLCAVDPTYEPPMLI